MISNKDWYSGGNVGWGLFDNTGGEVNWNFADGSSRRDLTFTGVYDDVWHLITITNDRDGLAVAYVDGAMVNSLDISGVSETIDSGFSAVIGVDGAGNYPFTGAIDDVKICSAMSGFV